MAASYTALRELCESIGILPASEQEHLTALLDGGAGDIGNDGRCYIRVRGRWVDTELLRRYLANGGLLA